MEKFRKPYDKEFMRMAMLKHEETFKEQVRELHRLYRIQKIMMRNVESNRPNSRTEELWSSKNGFGFNQTSPDIKKSIVKLDLERPDDEDCVAASNGNNRVFELIDESEIELTLGPSSYNRKKKADERTLASDSGQSFSSSSTGSSNINRAWSLSHRKTNKTREELRGRELGIVGQVPDMALGYQNGSKNSLGVVEELLRQERLKQPPWLCQVLSLNMT